MRNECKYANKMTYNRFVNGELKEISVNECFAVLESFECTEQCRDKCGKYKPLNNNLKLSWIPVNALNEQYGYAYKCARCGTEIIGTSNYCSHCGYEYEPWDGKKLN